MVLYEPAVPILVLHNEGGSNRFLVQTELIYLLLVLAAKNVFLRIKNEFFAK